jgi:hypothetical protein
MADWAKAAGPREQPVFERLELEQRLPHIWKTAGGL